MQNNHNINRADFERIENLTSRELAVAFKNYASNDESPSDDESIRAALCLAVADGHEVEDFVPAGSNLADAFDMFEAAKLAWVKQVEGYVVTDDAADEAIVKALTIAELPIEGDTEAAQEEYNAVIFPALNTWHKPNAFCTRSNDSYDYDYPAIEAALVELGATPEEADRMTDSLHEQGWTNFECVMDESEMDRYLDHTIDVIREGWSVDADRQAKADAQLAELCDEHQ